jgi:phosphate transport system substrate-binding protein
MFRFLSMRFGIASFAIITVLVAACGSTSSSTAGVTCPTTSVLNGAGSTFDNPLFTKMFREYPAATCGRPINYQAVGSGAGINDLLTGTVDFGATDTPMSDTQLAQSKNGAIIHIPVTLGAVAVTYNLSGVSSLNLSGTVLADMYLGKITSWDDPAIAALNTGTTLPHKTITIVHRSDGSGTTGIFSHYLAAVSPTWSSQVGAGTTINWPTGVGGKGSDGVAAVTKTTDGAVGYVELAYANSNNLPSASIQNANGKFVAPSLDGAKADAANVTTIPDDLRFFIVNAPGDASYPISGFSWVVVYQHQTDADKGQALADAFWWMTHDGQQFSTALTYVPLPATIVTKAETQIKSMTCGTNNAPCYTLNG